MSNNLLVKQILMQIAAATQTVQERFERIITVEDFTHSPDGKMVLDSICMLLIAIGDSLKKIDKLTEYKLLQQYHHIDWVGAKGTRDIIAHHYFDVDAEQIFFICQYHIEPLHATIQQMLYDLEK